MKVFYTLVIFVCLLQQTICQNESNPIFNQTDNVYVNVENNEDIYYQHSVKKGHTIYSLSKTFKTSTSNIYSYNNISKGASISIGQIIKIPFSSTKLYTEDDLTDVNEGHFIPVYYKVKPKDNLYRIAKVYFKQSIPAIQRRNEMESTELEIGQEILLGWLSLGKLPSDNNAITQNPAPVEKPTKAPIEITNKIKKENTQETNPSPDDAEFVGPKLPTESELEAMTPIDSSAIEEPEIVYPEGFDPSLLGNLEYDPTMKTTKRSQVAYWDKSIPDNGTIFALHQTAIIGSHIRIFNPLLNRTVLAKVIGRIPYGSYTTDVKLLLSPRAAKQLGARDSRFSVKITALMK